MKITGHCNPLPASLTTLNALALMACTLCAYATSAEGTGYSASETSTTVSDGTWISDLSTSNWNDPANWSGGVIANGADSTAYFTNAISDSRYAVLQDDRTIGHLEFSDGGGNGNFRVLDNAHLESLTLATTTGTPTIHCLTTAQFDLPLAGTQGFLKTGGQKLIINGWTHSALTGDIFIQAGELNTKPGTHFNNSVNFIVNSPGELVVQGSLTIGGLSGDGNAVFNGATLTVGADSENSTYDGTFFGFFSNGTLVKTGSGTLTLTRASGQVWTGGTRLDAGILSVSNGDSLGNADGSGGALTFDGGILQVTGTSFSEWTQGYAWEAGGGGFDIADASHTFIVNDALTGGGGLIKKGAGTLVLAAANTFGGITTVEAGTLQITHADALVGTTVEMPASGLDFSGVVDPVRIGGLTGTGDVPACSALIIGGNGESTSYSGSISGCGPLTKTGSGILTLTGGTHILNDRLSIEGGTLAVDGADIQSGSDFRVGETTPGAMTHSDGIISVDGTMRIGNGAQGFYSLSGTGQLISSNEWLVVGYDHEGSFDQSGGSVDVTAHSSGKIYLGEQSPAVGQYTLSGGSLAADEFIVGLDGYGRFDFTGGTTSFTTLYIARNPGSTGFVTVEAEEDPLIPGEETIALSSNTVFIGGSGTGAGGNGQLTIGKGDQLTGVCRVWSTGTLAGEGNVTGGVLNEGTVAPGQSAGTITISNYYTQTADGKLSMEIGGRVKDVDYDHLHVDGEATLDGTLEVALINNFDPEPGDTFDLMEWNLISGTFATLLLPDLGALKGWNTTGLYRTGTLRIVSFDADGDGVSDSWENDNGFNPDLKDDVWTLDSDSDGDSDILEIAQGTDRFLPNAKHGLTHVFAEDSANTLKCRHRRSTEQTAVTVIGQWSRDLMNWHHSGESDGNITVTLSNEVVETGTGFEIVETTATSTGSGGRLFYRINPVPNE